MKNQLPSVLLLVACLCAQQLKAAEFVLDFTETHQRSVLLESVPSINERQGTGSLGFEDENVILRFPGGREFRLRASRGVGRSSDGDALTSLSLYTTIMPAEEAAEVIGIFKRSFGKSTEDVDLWVRDVQEGRHQQPLKFEELKAGTGWAHYPAISLRAKSSMNSTYEWELSFFVQWVPSMYPDGWDEEKAAEHNPRPPKGYERISLDPPSGRFYSRAEGMRLALEGMERELAASGEEVAQVKTAEAKETEPEPDLEETEKAPEKPAEADTPDTSEKPAEQSSNWWLWLIGAVVVVGGIDLVVRRKS